jgi:VanZ family protein
LTAPERAGAWVYWLPSIATAAFIFWLSHQPDLPRAAGLVPDWLAHAVEYGFFTLTLVFATTRGFDRRRRTMPRVLAAVVIASLYGVTDEWHQSFVGRDATVRDWGADTVGALLAAAVVLFFWRRELRREPPG